MSKTWYDKAKKAKTFEAGMNFVIGRDSKQGKYIPVIAQTPTAAGKELDKFQKEVCDKQGLERIKSMVGRLTSVGIMVATADSKILSAQFLKEAKAAMPAPWKTKLRVVLPTGEVLVDASDEDAAEGNDAEAGDTELDALRKRLGGLVPQINAVKGDMGPKLQASAKRANDLIAAEDLAGATKTIESIEKALKLAQSGGGGDAALKKLAEKLAELKPQLQGLPPEHAKTLTDVWELAAKNVRAKDAENAAKRIKALTAALAKLDAGSSDAADPAEKEWKLLLAKLTPAVAGAVKSEQAGAAKLREALAGAVGKAKAGDFKTAIAIGKKLAAALAKTSDASDDFAPRWKAARDTWTSAIETVDGQISKLQVALNTFDDAELKEISEFGLNAITANHKVLMMAAIQDVTSAGAAPDKSVISNASQHIAAFEALLASDPRVTAVDNNPFGVSMSVASTLRPALAEMGRVLQSAG